MNLRAIVKIHGGKNYLKNWIISKLPSNYQDLQYVEPFGGSASVLLTKLPSKVEIYNDLDTSIYNVFYYLKTNPQELISLIEKIPYSQESFVLADKSDGLVGAVDEIVRRRMSRGGLKKSFCWSNRLRGGRFGEINSWENYKKNLPHICSRLKDVELFNKNALELIAEKDTEETVFYLDPTYVPETRTAKKTYDIEMSEKDHCHLAEMLQNVKGKVLLSGYYSKVYAKAYKDWNMSTKNMPNHSSQSKKKERRIECLWRNYD